MDKKVKLEQLVYLSWNVYYTAPMSSMAMAANMQ